jgi:hypothetical protein
VRDSTRRATDSTRSWQMNQGGGSTSREKAQAWIAANKLDGVLTLYPLDTGVYEWAIAKGKFTPKQEKHSLPKFIGSFATASMAHHHYEQGICRT